LVATIESARAVARKKYVVILMAIGVPVFSRRRRLRRSDDDFHWSENGALYSSRSSWWCRASS
jgi:hypothetical protein